MYSSGFFTKYHRIIERTLFLIIFKYFTVISIATMFCMFFSNVDCQYALFPLNIAQRWGNFGEFSAFRPSFIVCRIVLNKGTD